MLAVLITGILGLTARWFLQQIEPAVGVPEPSSFGSLPAAIDALQNGDLTRQHRLIAISAVTKYGEDAVPELRRLLRSRSASTRTLALMALRDLGSTAKPSLPELTALVEKATPEELTPLVSTLARIAPASEPMIRALKSCATSGDSVDHNTVLTLLPLVGQGQEDILRLLLRNGDQSIQRRTISRIAAQEALASAFVEDLERLLDGQPEATSSAAFGTLQSTNNLSDATLNHVLDNAEGQTYLDALYELQNRPPLAEARYDELLSVLRDDRRPMYVRESALKCLAVARPDDRHPCEHVADWILNDEAAWASGAGWSVILAMLGVYGLNDADSVGDRIALLHQDASAGSVLLLKNQRVTAELTTSIAQTPQLRVLVFHKCELSEDALEPLEALTALRILSLEICQLTDGHLLKLPTLPALTHFKLWERSVRTPSGRGFMDLPRKQITNGGMPGIARQPALQVLTLTNIDINDDAVAHLSELSDLRYFRNYAPQHDLTPRALSKLKSLRYLEVRFGRDSDLRYVNGMLELQQLHLQGDDITDAGLALLGKLAKLRSLRIRSDKVTVTGIQHLQTLLPECRIELN